MRLDQNKDAGLASIFLSYRRDDAADVVGRIRDRLVAKYGADEIFVDVDAIPYGVDYRDYIDAKVKQCDVFIAAIGSEWLDARDTKGKRRIDNHDDLVRIEIAAALVLQVPIIPVLVRGADIPVAEDLPEELRPLTLRNGLPIRPDPDFNGDVGRLISGIGNYLIGQPIRLQNAGSDSDGVVDDGLVEKLRSLRAQPDISALPLIFDCLAHDNDSVRQRAMQIVHKIGWPTITLQIERVVKSSSTADIDRLLNGVASVEATQDTVAVLTRLCDLLVDNHRARAFSLTRKKRLALQLNHVAQLFEKRHPSYDIIKVLGQGLFTASYLARHRQNDDEAVVRVLLEKYVSRDDIRTKSLKLWKRSMRYVHESLVLTRDVGQYTDEGVYYCIRDYITGETLQNALHAGRKFDDHGIITVLRSVTSALKPIHVRNEVHGGIRPSNIFLVNADDVRLGDTSLSVTLVRPSDDRIVLDYPYSSPESFNTSQTLSPQSDFYSLGCVAFELLSGVPPFVSDNEFALAHLHQTADVPSIVIDGTALPDSGQDVIRKLMSKRPEDRPSTPAEALQLLSQLENCLKVGSHVPSQHAGPPSVREESRAVRADVTRISMPSNLNLNVDRTIFPTFAHPTPGAEFVGDLGTNDGPAEASWGDGAALKTGSVVRDRFVLEELIGQGGMGTVYKALDRRKVEAQDRFPYVALKVLNEDFKKHPDSLIALQRESRKAQDLAHPNIVTVFDFDRDGDNIYMSMELLQGTPLDVFIRNQQADDIDPQAAMSIIEGISHALAYAHSKGIVHSDLKPGNCYLTAGGVVKIFDFGIARATKPTGDIGGTTTVFDPATLGAISPAYASVEMLTGMEPDPRDDIYALACISYELLTGRHPFDKQTALVAKSNSLVPNPIRGVSTRVNRAILKNLSFDRDSRSDSAEEFLRSFDSPRGKQWLFGIGAFVLVVLAAIIWLQYFRT